MTDCAMSDQNIRSENARLVATDMQCGVVLDIGTWPDDDWCEIGTENGVPPNAGVLAEGDIADDPGTGSDIHRGINFREEVSESIQALLVHSLAPEFQSTVILVLYR